MNYDVLTIPPFDRQLKRLAKKYPSLKSDYSSFLEGIERNPKQGKSLGRDCYKIRLSIASKGKGKSGGARIILHIVVWATTVYLLTIYDKGDKESLSDKELNDLLKNIPD